MARTQIDESLIPAISQLATYRRPNLSFVSITTVGVESGIFTGTSGDCTVFFPDGRLLTVNSTTQTVFDITRNASLSGTKQSGLRTSLSEATNTWYALYAVRATDNDDTWVTVGDTVLPLVANYATLNSNFVTGKWCYLGLIRNGDNSGATGNILAFTQSGNQTCFSNVCADAVAAARGTRLANTASATTLTYTYSAGTGTTDIPGNIGMGHFMAIVNSVSANTATLANSAGTAFYGLGGITTWVYCTFAPASAGARTSNSVATAQSINLAGFIDSVLGVGPTLL